MEPAVYGCEDNKINSKNANRRNVSRDGTCLLSRWKNSKEKVKS